MSHVKSRISSIEKSKQDDREYRGLILDNDMKVVLISDPTTDKAAASLDVNVGFMSEPRHLPGLAHFCEHMLFLGTKKYPEENEYSKYLSEHGGMSNAYTDTEHTNYYFDVVPENLGGALDRFAQFFLGPLFNESATDREVKAVNSEHEKNVSNDSWRMDQMDKSTSKPDHPYNHFGTGNKETLVRLPKEQGIDIREELLKFHSKWYSSNIMSLCVLGKDDLDTLEKLVVDLFSATENKHVEVAEWLDHPYGPDQLKSKGFIVPVKDLRNLNILFPIPDLTEHYKASPGGFLTHLIGHEGSGSLLSALKAAGWCSNLSCGVRTPANGFAFFSISVDLTEDGIEHVDDIIKYTFQYIHLLEKEGIQEWLFKENRDILAMHFRFKDKVVPSSYVSYLSRAAHDYPLEELLCAPYLLKEWRPDLIKNVLSRLTPDNMRVAVIGKKFESIADQTEKWYGTKYKHERIPDSLLESWKKAGLSSDLHLPEPNEFIPTDFELAPRDTDPSPHPCIAKETNISRTWYKQDDVFLLPKCNLKFEFISSMVYLDPLNTNMTSMFVVLLKDALNEYAYSADLAGLKWDLTSTKYGLELVIGGYNHKQHVLLEKVIDKMTNFTIDPKRFEILKENFIRSLKNFEAEQPYQHAVYYLTVLLSEHAWTVDQLLAAAHEMTVEKVAEFIPQLLSKVYIVSLVHGNTTKQRALEMIGRVEEALNRSVGL
ncbi:insulin-degrading enzyme isoform X2 [Nilaparvata lugens]|nr:insulin-degrading enzyme isoform X2 [Nilaparvata lugens]XP_039282846.1 insulin-degrading enzyme isoform X2 [Nilaparvata lugens]XP_039282847.1 insulin-degrading enzyme isoform X2 [Nilaparvata lugens]